MPHSSDRTLAYSTCTACLQAGEFWWKLALEATAPLPQPPIELSAPLGSTAHHTLSITNPTAAEAVFTSSSSSPDKFWVVPQSFKVSASCMQVCRGCSDVV